MATKRSKSASKKGSKARAASKKAGKGGAKMGKARFATMRVTDFVAKKPIAITPDGKFILLSEAKTASFTLPPRSLHTLNEELQAKLTLERVKRDPKYNLGVIGGGQVTKEEVIANVEARTEFGREVIRAEINYCNQLLSPQDSGAGTLRGATVTSGIRDRIIIDKLPPIVTKLPPPIKILFKTIALFAEDTTDNLTNMAAQYRKKHVHPAFKNAGFSVVVLEGSNDVRAQFAVKAKDKRVVYISGVGHGSPTTYTGHLGSPVLQVGNYDSAEAQGKVIHLLSCQTAKQLGPDLIKKKAKAYMGYFENFTFVFDNPNTPTNEIELFWKCDSTFDITMAKGGTVEKAHNATIAAFNAAIASVPNTSAATWLTWDRDVLRSPVINAIYGSKTVVLPKLTFNALEMMQEAMQV